MALIKCPECGKEVSDKAVRCPHCGMPLNEIHSVTQESTNNDAGRNTELSQSQKEKKRIHKWLLVIFIVGSLLLIGGIVFLFFNGKSTDNSSTQDNDTTGNVTISEINGVPIDKFIKYSTKYGKTYYYRDDTWCTLYDESGDTVYEMYNYELIDIVEEGSDIAVVTHYVRQPLGSSIYNCGGYCITIIDQSTYSEKNGLCGFDDVKISNGDSVCFNTLIANTPTKLTFTDIVECQGYYEDALEHLYKKKHPTDFSWMNGEWSLTSSINDPWLGRRIDFRLTLNIDANKQTIRMIDEDRGDGYSGTYTINESQNMISCNGNCVHFDPNKKLFYEEFQGERDYYHKYNSNEGEKRMCKKPSGKQK